MQDKGISIRPIYFMNGSHLYNEVFLDDVHTPAGNIIGKENGGWAVVNVLASFERSSIAPISGLVRLLEELVDYCNTTQRDGYLLAKNPIVRNQLGQLACALESVRMLAYRIADMQSRREMGLIDAAAVKVFASELTERFSRFGADLLGPYGQVKNSRFAKLHGSLEYLYQFYHGFITAQGTNDIQRNIIAWYGLGLPRVA
jgi:alkylation response protein AidB-like acyl-CoA dehydrogenase